jgi:Flp pilus assembly CpaE family ATPase
MNEMTSLRPTGGTATAAPTVGSPRTASPLLAVCGVCGGAGASTLAYLTARSMAGSEAEPALACDTGGPSGGLAAYAQASSPRSLAGAADAIAAGDSLDDGLFANPHPGLRVIARGPELRDEGDPAAIGRLLDDAREVHRLTVVDCGTLQRAADRMVLAAATHVAWVVPATARGVGQAAAFLDLFPAEGPGRELVVARSDSAAGRPPIAELAGLAELRNGPLVLMPSVADLAEKDAHRALEQAGVALEAIHAVVRR